MRTMTSITAMAALSATERFAAVCTSCWEPLVNDAGGAERAWGDAAAAGRGALRPTAAAGVNVSVGKEPTSSSGVDWGTGAVAADSSGVAVDPGETCRAAGAGFSKVTSNVGGVG